MYHQVAVGVLFLMLSPFPSSAKYLRSSQSTCPKKRVRQKSIWKQKLHAYTNSVTTNLLEIFTNEDMILCLCKRESWITGKRVKSLMCWYFLFRCFFVICHADHANTEVTGWLKRHCSFILASYTSLVIQCLTFFPLVCIKI